MGIGFDYVIPASTVPDRLPGLQIFNAGNDNNSAHRPAAELAATCFPGVPLQHALEGEEALYSNRKIRELLGFKEQHNWRQYLPEA